MSDLRGRLTDCFVAVFPDLPRDEIPAASVASIPTWDSLAAINLAGVVEEEFGIEIDADGSVELISFDLVLDYLSEHPGVTDR